MDSATILLLFLLIAIISQCLAMIQNRGDQFYRIFESVEPSEYNIALKIHMEDPDPEVQFTFEGRVQMKMTIRDPIVRIYIQHDKLRWLSVPTVVPNEKVDIQTMGKYQFSEFYFVKPLNTSLEYLFTFEYKGKIETDMIGFYRASYREGNVTKWYAATNLKPIYARRLFPCFDEPKFKSVFKLSVECPENYTCTSNMKEKSKKGNTITFEDTPLMSAYHLGLVVSNFEKKTSPVNPAFSYWSRPEVLQHGVQSLETGVKLLAAMEEYTGIPYSASNSKGTKMKMDNFIFPNLDSGSAEYWGIPSHRESTWMSNPNKTSTTHKQQMAMNLAHETSHAWFGNLVTCNWWSETWLNEGLAMYFQYKLADKVLPGYGIEKQFVIDEIQAGMIPDNSDYIAILNEVMVSEPDEVARQVYTVHQGKGVALLRMMEHWLGASTFQKAIRYYIGNNSFSSVSAVDLASALRDAADEDQLQFDYPFGVFGLFLEWTTNGCIQTLYVKRFRLDGVVTIVKTGPLDPYPAIPLTYTTSDNPNFSNTKSNRTMCCKGGEIFIGNPDWIIFNVQQVGYYRVHYTDDMYDDIITALKNDSTRKIIHELNRAQIVDDAIEFARTGRMPYIKMFEVMQFLEIETEYTPWASALAGIERLRYYFRNFKEVSENFDLYISALMKGILNNLGFDAGILDSGLRKMFRTKAIKMASKLKIEHFVNESNKLFDSWIKNASFPIPNDHREFVYCNGIRYAQKSQIEIFWTRYLAENNFDEKNIMLMAMGCTSDNSTIDRILNSTLNDDQIIKSQDRLIVFDSVLNGNLQNIGRVYNHFEQNFKQYQTTFGHINVEKLITNMVAKMSTKELDMFSEYVNKTDGFSQYQIKLVHNSLRNTEEILERIGNNETAINNWIIAKYKSSSTIFTSSNITLVPLLCLHFFFTFLFK